jgi:uncharacterized protein involved in exopolysaccharide biosynthesis
MNRAPSRIRRSLRDVLRAVFRHKGKSALLVMIGTFAGVYVVYDDAAVYESVATLLVEDATPEQAAAEQSILSSAIVVERTAGAVGASTKAVRAGTQVTVDGNLLHLRFGGTEPAQARAVADALVAQYQDRRRELQPERLHIEPAADAGEPLFTAIGVAEQALQTYRAQEGIIGVDQRIRASVQHAGEVSSELNLIRADVEASEARLDTLQAALVDRTDRTELQRTTGVRNRAADALRSRVTELQLEKTRLQARYSNDHRLVAEVQAQIALAESALRVEDNAGTEVTTGIDRTYQALHLALEEEQAKLQASQARERVLKEVLEEEKSNVATLTVQETQLAALTRRVAEAEAAYENHKVAAARVTSALGTEVAPVTVRVLQPATLPLAPVHSARGWRVVGGIALGIVAAMALSVAAESWDDRLKTAGDVERQLQVSVLASISEKEFTSCI